MGQKIFGNRAYDIENKSLRSDFDLLFDDDTSIVEKRRREQMENAKS